MKERPMLMSAPMVRAILAGTKTQTRRVVKPQPHDPADGIYGAPSMIHGTGSYTQDHMLADGFDGGTCSYGQPGDRLWVRESGWERPERTPKMMREGADTWPRFAYAADDWNEQDRADFKAWGFKPRPSIHMPRWASRILLEIVSVRVERLQVISDADAIAEGITSLTGDKIVYHFDFPSPLPRWNVSGYQTAKAAYSVLWESINGPGSWDANPWVWVIEFKRVQP